MKGISTIHVHLLGSSFKDTSALAQIVIDIIILCVLIFAWNRLPEVESLGGAFWGVSMATNLLLAWVPHCSLFVIAWKQWGLADNSCGAA